MVMVSVAWCRSLVCFSSSSSSSALARGGKLKSLPAPPIVASLLPLRQRNYSQRRARSCLRFNRRETRNRSGLEAPVASLIRTGSGVVASTKATRFMASVTVEQQVEQTEKENPLLEDGPYPRFDAVEAGPFNINEEELRPFFSLPRVTEGLFNLAKLLFGVDIEAADGVAPVWHKDVQFFRVKDLAGEPLAYFYFDPYSRPSEKRGGAWMDEVLGRSRLLAPKETSVRLPVAHMVCNQTPPVGDEPSLMTFREVETVFHEFGHALQHMLTKQDEGLVAGIRKVEWDAVELPSQFMENWCYHRATLLGIAKHYKTGETLSEELYSKLLAARTFRAASMMLRQIHFTLVDLELHSRFKPGGFESIFDVDRRIAKKTQVIPPLAEDRFLCGFSHIFAGGYSAGYYSYKWAEVLSADAFSAFEEASLENEVAVKETRKSFVCLKDFPHARFDMATPIPAALGAMSASKLSLHTYSRGRSTQNIAAASFTGCLNLTAKNMLTVRTSRLSNPQFFLGLYAQSTPGFMSITTSALNKSLAVPLYRKRRKKGRGKGSQSSALPAREVAQVLLATQEKSVVVVESPAKARTIEKYLGERHVVLPSFGHVRDLAAKSGSVRPDEDFKLVWEVPSSARQHLNAIKAAIKGASNLFLASDPDREGEAIAWHVLEMLKMEGAVHQTLKVSRVVFNEITKAAVVRAMEVPRDISVTLVDAYLARRALDYLIGFDLSPVLWRKLPGSKSAGRVQSAALRLICERELEMEAFVAQEYWTVDTEVSLADRNSKPKTHDDTSEEKRKPFPAKVTHVDGEKLSQFSLTSNKQAESVAQRVEMSNLSVSSVKKSMARRFPLAPYITSSLQQDASTKLAFGASRTMALAQQLYEGVKLGNGELTGLITYMRTDGVQLSGEAVQNLRTLIAQRYGDDYVPQQPRQFTSRVKNAQEAHEAIRPTDINRLPAMLVKILDEDALRLYSLIWCRTIASQMEPTIYAQVAVDISNGTRDLQLRATGSSVSFPGFLAAFKDKAALAGSIEDGTDNAGEANVEGEDLRSLEAGDSLSLNSVQPHQHFTEPPARYSEGSLVKKMEELGIGRPSTYASTLRTLQSRSYVRIEKRRIFPEGRGRMVSAFLSHYFPKFSDYEFTAKLETQLDDISAGRAEWKNVLENFWPDFHEGVTTVLNIPFEEVVNLLEDAFSNQFFSGSTEKLCPSCNEGKMGLKLSRFGSGYFLGCSRYPKCMYKTSALSADGSDSSDEEESPAKGAAATKIIGVDPSTSLEVVMKTGPYGKYVQMGSFSKKQKPKRTAIPKDMSADEITLNEALELLKYPYELGRHPETKYPIMISTGHYGPFLRCKAVFVSIPKESISTLTVEEAVALLSSKNVSRSGRKVKPQKFSKDADATSIDQPKASKSAATKAKGRATSSAKNSAPVAAISAKKAKDKASEGRKKSAGGAKESKRAKSAGDAKEKQSDKLAGDAKSNEKITAKAAADQGKENGAGNVKKGRGRPRSVPTSAGEAALAGVKSR